jgi:hypothetical protein
MYKNIDLYDRCTDLGAIEFFKIILTNVYIYIYTYKLRELACFTIVYSMC